MEHKWGDYRDWVYLCWAKLYESLFFIIIMFSRSVMSHSLWPRALWPAKLLCQWDFSGKNTGVGCPFLLQGMFLTQRFKPCLLHCRYILYYQETSWITIINFKRSYENTVSFVLLHVCRMLLHLSFKCLMSISLTLPCHLIFAPLWGPSICWEYTPIFLLLWPPDWLQLIFSGSTCVWLALTPLLWGTRLCSGLLQGLCWLTLSIAFVSHNLGMSYSLPSQVHEPLEGTGCVFLWGAQHRTCYYECLLNECSNPIWWTQNVWKCDIKPPFTWKSEVVMKCVVLVPGRTPGVHCVMSPWCEGWLISICVYCLERGHSHGALNPCLICW